jgi:hypothetical protein
VVRIEGDVVKKCKSVVKTLKTVVKINCMIGGAGCAGCGEPRTDGAGHPLPDFKNKVATRNVLTVM